MNVISPLLGIGVYNVSVAAKLAEVPVTRARAWVLGYPGKLEGTGARKRRPPLIGSRLADVTPDRVVSFADLLEMRFTRHFRTAGFSWKRILAHLPELRRIVLQRQGAGRVVFESDRVRIFAEAILGEGRSEVVELDTRQLVLVELLRVSFREELRFSTDGLVEAWHPRAQYPTVLIDPARQFGDPIVEPGVPTSVLADALLRSDGDANQVARRFGVSPTAAIEAHRFETDLRVGV